MSDKKPSIVVPFERIAVLGNRFFATRAVNSSSIQVVVNRRLVSLKDVLFDTGSELTTLPTKFADDNAIPYSKSTANRFVVRGATGQANVQIDRLTYRFKELPHLEFETWCAFSETVPRPLWSLQDVVANFAMRHRLPNRSLPFGALELELLNAHQGRTVAPL
jgi:hypothetical protein